MVVYQKNLAISPLLADIAIEDGMLTVFSSPMVVYQKNLVISKLFTNIAIENGLLTVDFSFRDGDLLQPW